MESAAPLTAWSNFYTMIGSSAAALTGLMFVVITLVSDAERTRRSRDGISVFSTPTVVHFCMALLVAAILNAPWRTLVVPAVLLGVAGIFGVAYSLRVSMRTTRLNTYTPDTEDWIWYVTLPVVAYVTILTSGALLLAMAVQILFALAGGVLLLIFIGIHNSWDVVTFLAVEGLSRQQGEQPRAESSETGPP